MKVKKKASCWGVGCWPKKEKIDFPVRERPSTEVCPEGAAAAAAVVVVVATTVPRLECLLMESQPLKPTTDDVFQSGMKVSVGFY